MEIKNSIALVSFIILIVVLGLTLYNIHAFMESEKKCEPGFKVIQECNCIPDESLAKLLGVDQLTMKKVENGSK